ncbi:uncharacterized protein LOC134536207 [Bacillus rossius redtenbacheri]|uniref:uncharacterized protein LOC134536207 n=1 Tax=Bacillus rossius redtenbacheri TaxID=93214 RepID=UPI002FDE2622
MTRLLLPLFLLGALGSGHALPRPRLQADLNGYMDKMIAYLKEYLNTHDMNPYLMPNVTRSLNLLLLSSELDLYSGLLYQLDTIQSEAASMDYGNQTALITADLGFNELKYEYPFRASVDGLAVRGLAHGVLDDLKVRVELNADLANLTDVHVSLQDLVISHTGTLTVLLNVDGGLLDFVADAVSSVLTGVFKDIVMAEVQKEAKVAVQSAIRDIDFNVGGH